MTEENERIKKMNIYEKMSAITNELKWVAKNLDVGEGKNQYKAVSEADILDEVKPIEAKYHIYSHPTIRNVFDQSEFTNKYGTLNRYAKISTTYRFVDMDNPASTIEICSFGEALDSGDKGLGKAMTYADKYALMKAYKIQTGEDPDAVASPKDSPEDTASAVLAMQSAMNALSEAGVNPRDDAVVECVKKHAKVSTIDRGKLSNLELARVTKVYIQLAEEKKKKDETLSPTDDIETY